MHIPTCWQLLNRGIGRSSYKQWWAVGIASTCISGNVAVAADQEVPTRDRRLEEVTVTAQKFEERLQDVPMSITALTGETMDMSRADSLHELLTQIPGVAVFEGLQSGQSQVVVRGVTSVNSVYGGASTTAYYLDNVPFGLIDAPYVPETNPYDLERLEVLRGPQGTLYGASSLNGVVRILTKDPDLDQFELKARALMSMTKDSDDENYRGDMAVNVPLIDGKLAVRAVLGNQKLGGWIDAPNRDDVNKVEGENYRLKLKAQPTDELSIVLSAWRNSYEDDAPPLSLADRTIPETNYGNPGYGTSTDYDVYGATIDYDFSNFSLSSRTGYLDYTLNSGLDVFGFFRADQYFKEDVFSEELFATSKLDSPLRWSLGALYRDAEEDTRQLWFGTDGTRTSESIAVFAELGKSFIGDKLDLRAGLRYFRDKASLNARESALPAPINTSSTFESVNPRVVLTLHPTDESIIYASYSEGFRSGIEQGGIVVVEAPALSAPADPDTLKNYEVGAKGSVFHGLLSFDTAIYFIDWQDTQQQLSVPTVVNGTNTFFFVFVNSESASGLGVDFALTGRPLIGLELGVNLSWNDLTLDSDVLSAGQVLFRKGDRINGSPKYTAGVFGNYSFPLGRGFEGRISASANETAELCSAVLGAAPICGEKILIAQASVSIESPDRWAATLFVDNLTDEYGTPFPSTVGAPQWDLRRRPRTIGLQFEYKY